MPGNTSSHLIVRKRYMDILRSLRDARTVKVITGMRGCGKSTILDILRKDLLKSGVDKDRIFRMDLDDRDVDIPQDQDMLTGLIESSMEVGPGTYIILDEV